MPSQARPRTCRTFYTQADKLFNFHQTGLSDAVKEVPGIGPVTDYSSILSETNPSGRRVAIWKCDIEGSAAH